MIAHKSANIYDSCGLVDTTPNWEGVCVYECIHDNIDWGIFNSDLSRVFSFLCRVLLSRWQRNDTILDSSIKLQHPWPQESECPLTHCLAQWTMSGRRRRVQLRYWSPERNTETDSCQIADGQQWRSLVEYLRVTTRHKEDGTSQWVCTLKHCFGTYNIPNQWIWHLHRK